MWHQRNETILKLLVRLNLNNLTEVLLYTFVAIRNNILLQGINLLYIYITIEVKGVQRISSPDLHWKHGNFKSAR